MNKNRLQVFETLPNRWEKTTLGEILPILYGKGLTKAKRDESGPYPVYGSSGHVGNHSQALTKKPALIIGRKGSVGEVYYSKQPCWPIDTVYYVEESEGIHLGFFEYLLRGLNLSQLDKSTAVPGLSRDDYNAVEVAVAPLNQQKRIVAEIEKQFSRLDEAVANLKRVKANLKRYKAAVLKAAVEGKLTEEWRKAHPDVEPASELLKRILAERRARWNGKGKYNEPAPPDTRGLPLLPERWTWASADQLSLKITDGEHLSPKTLELGVPLLSAKDVRESGVTFAEVKYVAREDADRFRNRCDPAQGDILIVSRGATIGRTCRVDTDVVFCLMGSVILIKPLSFVDTGFLLTALKSSSSHRLLRGISGSTAQQAIYIRDIRSIPIPLPPLDEQTQVFSVIEAAISNANSVDAAIDANFRRAERLRRLILSRAFCGRLVPANGALDWSERLEGRIYAN